MLFTIWNYLVFGLKLIRCQVSQNWNYCSEFCFKMWKNCNHKSGKNML